MKRLRLIAAAFFAKNKPKKNILACFLVLLNFSSFAKKKEKPAAAFKRSSVTVIASLGYPKPVFAGYRKRTRDTRHVEWRCGILVIAEV